MPGGMGGGMPGMMSSKFRVIYKSHFIDLNWLL